MPFTIDQCKALKTALQKEASEQNSLLEVRIFFQECLNEPLFKLTLEATTPNPSEFEKIYRALTEKRAACVNNNSQVANGVDRCLVSVQSVLHQLLYEACSRYQEIKKDSGSTEKVRLYNALASRVKAFPLPADKELSMLVQGLLIYFRKHKVGRFKKNPYTIPSFRSSQQTPIYKDDDECLFRDLVRARANYIVINILKDDAINWKPFERGFYERVFLQLLYYSTLKKTLDKDLKAVISSIASLLMTAIELESLRQSVKVLVEHIQSKKQKKKIELDLPLNFESKDLGTMLAYNLEAIVSYYEAEREYPNGTQSDPPKRDASFMLKKRFDEIDEEIARQDYFAVLLADGDSSDDEEDVQTAQTTLQQ